MRQVLLHTPLWPETNYFRLRSTIFHLSMMWWWCFPLMGEPCAARGRLLFTHPYTHTHTNTHKARQLIGKAAGYSLTPHKLNFLPFAASSQWYGVSVWISNFYNHHTGSYMFHWHISLPGTVIWKATAHSLQEPMFTGQDIHFSSALCDPEWTEALVLIWKTCNYIFQQSPIRSFDMHMHNKWAWG